MAERKPGLVKPPVIDLKAREAKSTAEDTAKEVTSETNEETGGDTAAKANQSTNRSTGTAKSARTGRRTARHARPAPTAAPEEVKPEPKLGGVTAAAPQEPAPAQEPAGESATPTDAPRPATDAGPQPADQKGPEATVAEPDTGPPDPPPSRPAEVSGEPEASRPSPPPPPPPPPPPRPPARLAMPWSAITIAAVAGAMLGAGLTYLAANWIALPNQAPPFSDPTPALAALAEQTAAAEARLAAVEDQARRTQVGLDATLAQFDRTASELRTETEALRAAIPDPQAIDLGPIETQLQTLEARVSAIAAGASPADAGGIAEALAGLDSGLDALAARLGGLETNLDASAARIDELAGGLAEARAAIAAQSRTLSGAEIAPAVRLPLVVSGLEAAFATGRPFTAELASLTTLLPDLDVPEAIATAADTGLARPEVLVARFEAALPDILAGQAGVATGDWAQDAAAWARSILALRPAREIEGDTPEAVLSRLEGAIGRRDFTAAAALFAQLPPTMREPVGGLAADIETHAAAEGFVSRLRAQALAPAAPQASPVPEVGT